MSINSISVNFKGTTDIYSITDSHQDTRKTRTLLSKVVKEAKKNNNVLLLNCGDMFKGIYPKELEADSFVKAKDMAPGLEIVTTLGNNDFGFSEENLNYLISTLKRFAQKGIKTVSANIFDKKSGQRPDWLKPYTIVERDGDKNFITGFCINNINTEALSITPVNQEDVIEEIKSYIEKEKPDNVIFLNHDYLKSSKKLADKAQKAGIHIDAMIGGHDHKPDGHLHFDERIYYPPPFSEAALHFEIDKKGDSKKIKNLKMLPYEEVKIEDSMLEGLKEYEQKEGLLNPLAPCRINFTKKYSDPCSLGSFLADEIKYKTDSDICIYSTGLLVKPLPYGEKPITNYDFKKTMMAHLPIQKVELTPQELKNIFEHSLKMRTMDISGNSKFLQASSNIKIQGICDKTAQKYTVTQIHINGIPVLGNKNISKIVCAIDEYIGKGGQGYKILADKEKQNTKLTIDNALKHALTVTAMDYPKGSLYPSYEINERVIE